MYLNQAGEISDEVRFEDDLFGNREPFGEGLSNLINNSRNESLIISVNAPWGEGKTFFLKAWKNYLIKEKEMNAIYFNSFKNDFIEDPFIALLGELLKHYKEDDTIVEKIAKKGANIIKGIAPLAGKALTRVALGGDIESIDNKLEKLIDGDITNFIGKKLESYKDKDDEIKIFKETIEEIIKEKGQLIFIIDELDRCRPDFALRLLERIKHFFDIKGLYFVLGINKDQLISYIRKVYGDIEAEIYLQKFFDVETLLPKNNTVNIEENDLHIYIKKIINDNLDIIKDKTHYPTNDLIQIIEILCIQNNISFRNVEKILNYILIYFKSFPKGNKSNLPILITIIIFIRTININSYKKIKDGEITKEGILKLLGILDKNFEHKEDFLKEIEFIVEKKLSDEQLERHRSKTYHYSRGNIQDKKYRLRIINQHINVLESFNI